MRINWANGGLRRMVWPAVAVTVVVASAVLVNGCPQPGPNVTAEPERSDTKTIGAAGGKLSCMASDGTVYTLMIPENALAFPVEITMSPVTQIRNLPLSGDLAGAVELEPTGLEFAQPAILEIDTSETPGAGQFIVGFRFEGDAQEFGLAFAGEDDGVLTLLVQHFSGAGVGFGTLQDVSAMQPDVIPDGDLANRIVALIQNPHTPQEEIAILEEWFTEIILPQLQNASNDAELNNAVSDYVMWHNDASLVFGFSVFPRTSPAFADERQQAAAAVASNLRAAIAENNELAAENESLSALANVLFWQTQASIFEMDLVAEQLDRARILAILFAHPVLEEVSLPDPLQVGFPHSLDLRFGLQFVGHPDTQAVPFHVELTAIGATFDNPTGFTAVDGSYTTVITATQDGGVLIEAKACLVFPGTTVPTDVCITEPLLSNGIDLTGTWAGTFAVNLGSGGVSSAPIRIQLDQNQNAITGTYDVLNDDEHFGTVSATLSGVDLLGFTLTQQSGCPGSFTGSAAVSTLDGGQRQIIATFNGSDCHNTHSGGVSTVTRQ